MASNEEILNLNKPYGRNWEDFLLPDQMEFLHRAMDAARKDEVEAWMKFFYDPVNPFIEIENGRYCQSSGGSTTWSFDQLYTIFKKQNGVKSSNNKTVKQWMKWEKITSGGRC